METKNSTASMSDMRMLSPVNMYVGQDYCKIKQKSVEKTFQNSNNVMSLGYFFKQRKLIGESANFQFSKQKLKILTEESSLQELATFCEPVYKRNDYSGRRLTKLMNQIQMHTSKAQLTNLKS